MKKILIVNWTQRNNVAGGVETRMENLHKILPNSELVSCVDILGEITNYTNAAVGITEYLEQRYKNDKDIVVIRDAACGIKSDIPQITIWANPFATLGEHFDNNFYREMSSLRLNAKNTIKVAIGKLLVDDMKLLGVEPDFIIPEAIDNKFWKPLNQKKKLRKKYNIPEGKTVGIWTGINHPIKNFKMFNKVMEKFPDIYWLKITKPMNFSREEMRDLYNCADFFILTSQIEGGGLSWLEATACDLPCIVSKTGCFCDFWDDRIGIRIDYDDFEQHCRAVQHILLNKVSPRDALIDMDLGLDTWEERWKKVVEKI